MSAIIPSLSPSAPQFSAYQIIHKKREGQELTYQETDWFIQQYANGLIPDYQMSALLMAIFLKGLNVHETANLTKSMLHSGKIMSFPDSERVIDKHSTGGIGDKTSFVLAPIAAAVGVKVPMIAGRSLGHTGGTVDKIEAVDGFQTQLTLEKFSELLNKNNVVLIGQTEEIAPADRKIYALRDVTATIESIPLITASIMSKKLAEGIKGLVLDIKYGNGAFMKTKKMAKELALSLMGTAKECQVHSMALISDMSQPLGNAVGHSLEIIESVETLKGNGPKDLTQLSLELAGGMIYLAQLAPSHAKGIALAKEALVSGRALEKFKTLITEQGGNPEFIDDYSKLPLAERQFDLLSPQHGHIKSFENAEIGHLLGLLGGGRKKTSDKIDHGVGFVFHKKKRDAVEKNEKLATIYFNQGQELLVKEIASQLIANVIQFGPKRPPAVPLIQERLIKWSKNAKKNQ